MKKAFKKFNDKFIRNHPGYSIIETNDLNKIDQNKYESIIHEIDHINGLQAYFGKLKIGHNSSINKIIDEIDGGVDYLDQIQQEIRDKKIEELLK